MKDALPHVLSHLVRAGQQRGRSAEGEVSSGDQRGRSAADEQRAASRGGRAHLADGVLDGRLEFVSQLWVGSVVEGAEGEVPASKRARGVDGRLSRRCKECASRRCKEGKRVWSPQGGEACMVATRGAGVYGRCEPEGASRRLQGIGIRLGDGAVSGGEGRLLSGGD